MQSEMPKILCIDDEESILMSLERVLKKHFSVYSFGIGKEALDWLQENSDCAVVLCDLHLPDQNGLDLLKVAKHISPNTVRAVLSGQIDLQDMMEAINRAEIDRFILKPWDNDYLELQMREALQTHILLNEKSNLQHLAITDIITGLTNHRYFQETLKKEFERADRHGRDLSLLMIDVDYFKKFNDENGHPEGDEALSRLAMVFREQVRYIDNVSRYGGEEFAIILPDTNMENAKRIAERIRVAVSEMSWSEDLKGVPMTISLGLSEYPTCKPNNFSELITQADQALYQAKRRGRNQTFVFNADDCSN